MRAEHIKDERTKKATHLHAEIMKRVFFPPNIAKIIIKFVREIIFLGQEKT